MKGESKPNILLIMTDQQRFDTCGPMAPDFLRTPHWNDLAREGITFDRSYAQCPVCVPSRVSTMSGRSAIHYARHGNGPSSQVLGRQGTLPDILRGLGYQTCAIGKMHFGPQRTRHGFEEMIIPEDYFREIERSGNPLQPMRHGLDQCELYPSLSTVPEPLTLTSWITEQCVRYILERRDPSIPFFLWCSYAKPHPPLDPPEPYYSMYRDCPIPEPVYGDWAEPERCPTAFERFRQTWGADLLSRDTIRAARAAYYGLVTQIDYNLGRLFAALQGAGVFDNTLIIYTSDHGEYLGDHHASSKVFHHEPAAHVPLVMRMPRSWPERRCGSTVSSPVTHADVLPTLVGAAGGATAEFPDGLNLIELARSVVQPRGLLEMCDMSWGAPDKDIPSSLAITDGRWKYIWYPEGGYEQLFDLTNDPRELKDLAVEAKWADKKEELHGELVRRHRDRDSRCVQGDRLVTVERLDDSEESRRANVQKVFATEWTPMDVRH